MAEDSIEKILNKFFQHCTLRDWKEAAQAETGGKDPLESLSWRGKDGNLFLPYYDAATAAPVVSFDTPAGKHVSARRWLNVPEVPALLAGHANAAALEHLSMGADGVLYDLRGSADADLGIRMKDILMQHCFVACRPHPDHTFDEFAGLFHGENPASVPGALFWESIPKSKGYDGISANARTLALGLIIPRSTPAQEVAEALLRGMQTLETFGALRRIAFSLHADANLYETVSKFKALRMLWFQVAHAYGHIDYKMTDLHLHAQTAMEPEGSYAPRENMLHATFAAMAAVLGGCDSLTVEGGDEHPGPRWARNVSNILCEESFLASALDPLAGAYAFDVMVRDLAETAWKIFQEKSSGL